jgi:hypothetical protein
VTIAFANCAAMRNLVTGRVVPQPAAQVTAKPLGPDLGTGPDLGSDLGMGPDKGRAGDSNVAARASLLQFVVGLSLSNARPPQECSTKNDGSTEIHSLPSQCQCFASLVILLPRNNPISQRLSDVEFLCSLPAGGFFVRSIDVAEILRVPLISVAHH